MAKTEKIAFSLPGKLLERLEKTRKAAGESRSAFVRRAIEQALAARAQQGRISRYREGYRRRPETADEIAAAEAAAGELLAEEPWE